MSAAKEIKRVKVSAIGTVGTIKEGVKEAKSTAKAFRAIAKTHSDNGTLCQLSLSLARVFRPAFNSGKIYKSYAIEAQSALKKGNLILARALITSIRENLKLDEIKAVYSLDTAEVTEFLKIIENCGTFERIAPYLPEGVIIPRSTAPLAIEHVIEGEFTTV